MGSLDDRVAELAARYLDLGVAILREAIRIPTDLVDAVTEHGGDVSAGLSNHEGARLAFLRDAIVDVGAVLDADHVGVDPFGNLVWFVQDPDDDTPPDHRRVIHLDGHADTVQALRPQWRERLHGAVDPYLGVVHGTAADLAPAERAVLRDLLGYLPPDDEWGNLVFGRGAADQLAGVVSQILATKILLELAPEGALRGAIVRAHATTAEEDNDGGGPRYLVTHVFPGAAAELIPDVVILTEGTGDAVKGALGIYRGQRGRMQIEVRVTGRSCHGSMPWEGLNPLEHAGAIVAEAAAKHAAGEGFLDHPFLGRGSRTASWSAIDTPSDCAVPERFVFRFDRRLTVGESPEQAVADIDGLDAVAAARAAGLTVDVLVPQYRQPTWTGFLADNPQIYPGWITPEDHPAIRAAVAAYEAVVSPHVVEPPGGAAGGGALRRAPRVDRWVFSTDGVGFPVPVADTSIAHTEGKRWVTSGDLKHPAMFGIGAGIEQNTHRIGECVDRRELRHAVAVLARFPSAYVAATT